jgi:hypothetical protein
VEFTESGWAVIEDSREVKVGYLHITEDSAEAITDACRDTMIRYFYQHDENTPGIGATPQKKYWGDLTREDLERIGNSGKRGYYNI